MAKSKELANLICHRLCLRGTCIFGGEPLCKQRGSSAINIKSELMTNNMQSGIENLSSLGCIENIIPSAVFRNLLYEHTCMNRICLAEPVKCNPEESALALSAAAISNIEQALQSKSTVLIVSLFKHKADIIFRARAICSAKSEHIIDSGVGILVSKSSICGSLVISSSVESVYKSIHNITFLSFDKIAFHH